MKLLGYFWCGLWRAHDFRIVRLKQPARLALQCARCGYVTRGWSMPEPNNSRVQGIDSCGRS